VEIEETATDNSTISTRAMVRYEEVTQTTVCRALKSANFHLRKIILIQDLHINDRAILSLLFIDKTMFVLIV